MADAAPSFPQRLRASALGLARAAVATPDLSALSGSLSAAQADRVGLVAGGKFAGGDAVEPSTWAQSRGMSGRPYWEQGCSSSYGDAQCGGFRSECQTGDAQNAFETFSAGQQSPWTKSGAESSLQHGWRDEFLASSSDVSTGSSTTASSTKSEFDASTLDDITSGHTWSEELTDVVERFLPDAKDLINGSGNDSSSKSKPATFDPNTVKRLRMILQHLAYTAPNLTVLSV